MAPRSSTLSRLFTLVLAGVLAGVLLGVAALPAGALAGFALKSVGTDREGLPEALRNPVSGQRSYIYANDGETLITTFYDVNRSEVTFAEIAPVMREAIVAAEDTRFYQHSGVDFFGLARAFVANATSGGVQQGASTLTMQYVRNVLKTDPAGTEEERAAATEETMARKLREIRYARTIEQEIGKDEILTRYLNIAYFGSGAYGIASAAERYFSKTPAELTLAESALIAGLVQSPEQYNPIDGDVDAALERRGYVLEAMVGTGAITRAQADAAAAEPLKLRPSAQPNGCAAMPSDRDDWGFFCDYLRQWWLEQPAFGDTELEREQALRRGGYKVITTLDPQVQDSAVEQALEVYGYNNKRAVPIAAVEPGTGRVLAMAVNRHYSLDANPKGQANYPNTVNQLVAGGGSVEGYQAGSTFKIFTLLAALENGKPLNTGYNSPSPLRSTYPDGGESSCGGYWCPVNANPSWMNGYRTMWDGFGRSVNTYFVQLAQEVGAEKAVEMAQRLGIGFRAGADAAQAEQSAQSWGAFTLGVVSTTPLELANAYATLAAEGTYCTPTPVISVTAPDGERVPVGRSDCEQVLDPDVARAATDAARCPVGQQSAFGRCNGGTASQVSTILGGRDVAGKTGSSDNNATETFVAYTPQIAVAGIAVNPDNPQDAVGSAIQSSVVRAVAQIMADAVAGEPAQKFTAPSRDIAYGNTPEPRAEEDADDPDERRTQEPSRDGDSDDDGGNGSSSENGAGQGNSSGGGNGSSGGGQSGPGQGSDDDDESEPAPGRTSRD